MAYSGRPQQIYDSGGNSLTSSGGALNVNITGSVCFSWYEHTPKI